MKHLFQNLTLVFIHGWGCRPTDFDAVIAHLNQKSDFELTTYAPTLPGHGNDTESPTWEPTIPAFAKFVVDFCDEEELKNVVLVGHSMGVRIVPEVWSLTQKSAEHKPNILGLVFLDGSSFKLASLGEGDGIISNLNDTELAALVSGGFSARTPESFKESTVQHVLGTNKTFRDALWDNIIQYDVNGAERTLRELGEKGTKALSLQATYISEDGTTGSLKEGEESQYMRYLKGLVPEIRQEVVEDSGHYVQVDQPECVAEKIFGFVESLTN